MLTSTTAQNDAEEKKIIGAHTSFVEKALQPHFVKVSALPGQTQGKEVVELYSKHISKKDRNIVCEHSRHARIGLAWYSQYVCAESHFFTNETIKKGVLDEKKTTNREIDLRIDFLSFAMTDASLLLLCETTGYKLVSPFRSDMAFMHLAVKIFCTPAGVAFDPVSKKLFLIDVHVDSMLTLDGALDSARESLLVKRTDLIYSLEIFGLKHGILVDVGFDRTSSVPVRTMRLVYVTRDSAVDVFGDKQQNGEKIFAPVEYVENWGALWGGKK